MPSYLLYYANFACEASEPRGRLRVQTTRWIYRSIHLRKAVDKNDQRTRWGRAIKHTLAVARRYEAAVARVTGRQVHRQQSGRQIRLVVTWKV
jgi:hypothetical protein